MPSILRAFLSQKCSNRFMCFALQSLLTQYKKLAPADSIICVFSPHTGHLSGMTAVPLDVMFSAIWGIIILAL